MPIGWFVAGLIILLLASPPKASWDRLALFIYFAILPMGGPILLTQRYIGKSFWANLKALADPTKTYFK
jgi:hypothetical protein